MRRVVSKQLLMKEKLMRLRATCENIKEETRKARKDNIIYFPSKDRFEQSQIYLLEFEGEKLCKTL